MKRGRMETRLGRVDLETRVENSSSEEGGVEGRACAPCVGLAVEWVSALLSEGAGDPGRAKDIVVGRGG